MPWIILLVSAVFEAVWATALGTSDGLSVLGPSVVFFVALALSMLGLGWATKHIPIGTAYAVWVGVGAALTVTYAILTGDESVSVGKVVSPPRPPAAGAGPPRPPPPPGPAPARAPGPPAAAAADSARAPAGTAPDRP